MAKKSIDDDDFLNKYIEIEIKYPFCYKTKDDKNYFRYLEDGRFEHICLEEKRHCLTFGNYSNSIERLNNDKDFWFKVLGNLNLLIDNEEFEFARELLMSVYKKYLNGDQFIAFEVERIIKLKEKREKEIVIENNDIIKNNDKDIPF